MKRKKPDRTPPPARVPPAWPAALIIVIAGLLAYSNSFRGVFVLDDVRAIVRNESIRALTPISRPLSPPPMSTVSGRPLANLSFAVNYAISAQGVSSYHALNLAIHLGTALTLFGVIRRTLLTKPLAARFAEDATYVAGAVALLWIVHPLTTSAVTYIVQRVESLMSLFYVLTMYCAIRAFEYSGERQRFRPAWAAAAIVSCALGMATKEVMVTAPLAVALWFAVFRPESRTPWKLLLGLCGTWLVFALLVSGEQRQASIAWSVSTAWRYLLTQAEVLTRYLRLVFVPTPLIFLYTWPLVTSVGQVIAEVLFVGTLLAATVLAFWKRHPAGFAGAMFFLILAPTSTVVPIVTEVAAEHRMYLPLAAVLALVVTAVCSMVRRAIPRGAARAVAAAAVIVALALGIQTRERNRVYASEQQIWADVVARDPDNQRARVAYASALAQSGSLNEAAAQFQRAVELNDADPIAHARLGSAQAALGRFDDAVPHLKRALALNPGDVEAHRTLGQILAMSREDAEAVVHLQRAYEAQPDDPQLVVQLASVLADSQDPSVRNPQRAIQLAERGVALTNRREAMALDVLGLAYARQGRFVEAVSAAQDALAIARAAGNSGAAASIESRLRAYEARVR